MVPLSVTSRAVFMVENNGFSDMEVSYRLPQHCPVDIVVSFPEGRQVSLCFVSYCFFPSGSFALYLCHCIVVRYPDG